jgi:NDP-sugar pyrophosphorylase family protein
MINLITMAGNGSRFKDFGITTPKPLISIGGVPMVIRAVECLPKAEKYVFVCRKEHIDEYGIDHLLQSAYKDCEIVVVDETTAGQACSAEIGILNSSIAEDDSILISCCDYAVEWDAVEYNKVTNKSDIVVWSTINNSTFSKNPSSYSWLDIENDSVAGVHVKDDYFKDPYNHHAIVGTFWFRRARDYIRSIKTIYDLGINTGGEYYIDNIFNTIDDNLSVRAFDVDKYYCWGTPQDLEMYYEN